jgi:putative ABC transport system permease protein
VGDVGLDGRLAGVEQFANLGVRWEAVLIVLIGLGLGLAITAAALLPLTHVLDGSLHPYVPAVPLAAILGTSALVALLALAVPTRRALRSRAVEALGIAE